MSNREAGEYTFRNFVEMRDVLDGISKTKPKVKKGLKNGASRVEALSEDGIRKATIALFHSVVTAFHVSKYDEPSQKWSKTTINFGASKRFDGIPVQVQYHDSVHETRIGLPVESMEEVPDEIRERLYGGVALFDTVQKDF